MREITVALKYARALFEAADEEGSLDRVGEDLAGLGKSMKPIRPFFGFSFLRRR